MTMTLPPAGLAQRLVRSVPDAEVALAWPLIERIHALKVKQGAVIVAHNYQVPLITAGIADFTGDSLAMARYGAQSDAQTIVVCGVFFMAESAKLLNPEKRVLAPNPDAGCSLAESVTAEDVRRLRAQYPGVPIVAYVNTTAAVKAEVDVCCTSANAVQVARSLGVQRLIMLPDQHLAGYVARQTGLEIIPWAGDCEVHVKYAGTDIASYRRDLHATIMAHPECPRDVQEQADFVGSTSEMGRWLDKQRPQRVLLLTECSMADNVALDHPEIEFLRPCNLCSYMKSITLQKVVDALENLAPEVQLDARVAARARRSLERMLQH